MNGRQALPVRKKSSIGCTIWMPALDTRTSTLPKVTEASTPAFNSTPRRPHSWLRRSRTCDCQAAHRLGRSFEIPVGDGTWGLETALRDRVADATGCPRDEATLPSRCMGGAPSRSDSSSRGRCWPHSSRDCYLHEYSVHYTDK